MLDPYGKIPEFKYCAARVAKKQDSLTFGNAPLADRATSAPGLK
jgi:hypothetical protein